MVNDPQNGSGNTEGGPEAGAAALTLPDLPPTVLSDQQLQEAVKRISEAKNGLADTPFDGISNPNKLRFLVAYALSGSKVRSFKAAGISTATFYTRQWREDAQFQDAVRMAQGIARDIIEDEIHRRGVEGWLEPTGWYKGQPGGYVRRFSDLLLIFRAKGELPDKYKDRMEVRGTFGHIDLNRVAAMPNGQDLLARLAAGESPFSVLGEPARPALPTGKPEVGTLNDSNG